MKKLIVSLTVLAFVGISASAFAAATQSAFGTGDISGDAGGGPTITIKLSPNVEYIYKGGNNGNWYVIATQNTSGTKAYAASQDISGIVMNNSLDPTIPAAASSQSWSGWAAVGQ